jgi:hypothetical protein
VGARAAAVALAAAGLAGGCFSPNYGNGEVACGPAPDYACPPGYTCNPTDNRCYQGGPFPDAAVPDAGVPDALLPQRSSVGITGGGGGSGSAGAGARARVSVGQPVAGSSANIEAGVLPPAKIQ